MKASQREATHLEITMTNAAAVQITQPQKNLKHNVVHVDRPQLLVRANHLIQIGGHELGNEMQPAVGAITIDHRDDVIMFQSP